MADFAFYIEEYGGRAVGEEGIFAALEKRAGDVVAGFERRYTLCWPTPDARDKAVCAVVDELLVTDAARDACEGGAATRIQAGSVSASYTYLSPEATAQSEEARCLRAVRRYGDVYRGASGPRQARRPLAAEKLPSLRTANSDQRERESSEAANGGAAWEGASGPRVACVQRKHPSRGSMGRAVERSDGEPASAASGRRTANSDQQKRVSSKAGALWAEPSNKVMASPRAQRVGTESGAAWEGASGKLGCNCNPCTCEKGAA